MSYEAITVVARLKAKKELASTVKEHLSRLVAPTRNEQGCISYDLHEKVDDETEFMFYENWESKESLDEHLEKPYLREFRAQADELLQKPMEVSLWRKIS